MYSQFKDIEFCIIVLKIASLVVFNGHSTIAQLSTIGRGQNYGPGSVGATSGGGNGAVGGGSGEVLAPKSLPLSSHEPTCEELRAMWRFSKRQSRAAEITNEIPTYRDPFAYNVWEPYYPTTRSVGGMRILPRYRDSTRPVYGRVVHREPLIRLADRTRVLEDFSRNYGAENKALDPRRRLVQFRFSGGNAANSLTPHHGSFQKLKELIWTERARELAQQRKAEEMAARAAVLKEIANGQSYSSRKQVGASSLVDENRSPEPEAPRDSILALPGQRQSTSIFSANPASSSSRSGGLVLPMMGSNGQPKSLSPAKPSHFRERNRALFRQSSLPFDYYQRDTRNDDQQQLDLQRELQQLSQYYQQQQQQTIDDLDFLNLFN